MVYSLPPERSVNVEGAGLLTLTSTVSSVIPRPVFCAVKVISAVPSGISLRRGTKMAASYVPYVLVRIVKSLTDVPSKRSFAFNVERGNSSFNFMENLTESPMKASVAQLSIVISGPLSVNLTSIPSSLQETATVAGTASNAIVFNILFIILIF